MSKKKIDSAPYKPQRRKFLQDKMICLLAQGMSQQRTADTIGVNEKTVRTWLKQPGMTDRLLEEVDNVLKVDLGGIMRASKMKALNGSHQHARICTDWLSKSMDRREKILKEQREQASLVDQLEFLWKDE